MFNLLKKIEKDFELYIGSVFILITTVVVVVNVFTRYFLKFTYPWAEEIAVGAFIWAMFLGFANAYKTQNLIGVEFLVKIAPKKLRIILELLASLLTAVISIVMFWFCYRYISISTKVTNALEFSYKYIYVSILIGFTIITLYSIYFFIKAIKDIFNKGN